MRSSSRAKRSGGAQKNKNVAKFLALIIAILAKNGNLGGNKGCQSGCCGGQCGGNQFGQQQPSGGLAINFNMRGGLMG